MDILHFGLLSCGRRVVSEIELLQLHLYCGKLCVWVVKWSAILSELAGFGFLVSGSFKLTNTTFYLRPCCLSIVLYNLTTLHEPRRIDWDLHFECHEVTCVIPLHIKLNRFLRVCFFLISFCLQYFYVSIYNKILNVITTNNLLFFVVTSVCAHNFLFHSYI